MAFKAQAPGSLMLLGEYAVLHGQPALVCALDKRITVTLVPRGDKQIQIQSSVFGRYETTLDKLEIVSPYHFVLGALRQVRGKLKHGCDLDISADFSHEVGLGSSAAVTTATLAALHAWLKIGVKSQDLVRQGRKIIRRVQKRGSGADIAASVYGGIVAYQMTPLTIKKFNFSFPLMVLYSGYKTPTSVALQKTKENFSAYPKLYKTLCDAIGQCARDGIQALRDEDLSRLGHVMNAQQGLMEALGVNTPDLQSLVNELRTQNGIVGAKISGSGLGDCVIGAGAMLRAEKMVPAAISLQGVTCEKI